MSSRNSSTGNNDSAAESSDAYHAELMDFLQESTDMRTAAKNSVKQGLWAGGGAMAGGMLMGPIGGMVGGVAGSLVGYYQSDDYDGVVQQLVKLPAARQSRLVRAVGKVLTDASSSTDNDFFESPQAFRNSLAEFAGRRDVREQIWRLCNEALNRDDSSATAPETVLTS
uniref:Uncharacterized protein n=1 Tax=Entomoneis paludosa TaxID=265537 RepID=A0A7S2Y3L1_9STRA|mmetsp:Transcript_14569/g.30090  ORF Transcript_14569/g.30090 Transcript_14569/m.30090 type:complete len:169 (+) Transcript_14569:74-580(+)